MKTKKELSERDIVTKYIIPAIEKAGFNKQTHILEEVSFTVDEFLLKVRKPNVENKNEPTSFFIISKISRLQL